MFSKRQRRPPEEEPLVPHGLVWQAMEDPPAEKLNTEDEKPIVPAESLRIPPVAAEETISPQLSRRVVKNSSVVCRTLFSRTVALLRHQASWISAGLRRFVVRAREISDRRDVNGAFLKLRVSLAGIIQAAVTRLAKARGQILEHNPREGLKRTLRWICVRVIQGARNAIAAVRPGHVELKAKARARFAPSLLNVQQDPPPSQPLVRGIEAHPIAPQRVTPRSGARIVMMGLLQRSGTLQFLCRDPRLWTSFVMAGFAALLVVGFISTVRHYAIAALPSHVLHNRSLTECAPSEVAGAVPPTSTKPIKVVRTLRRTAMASPKRAPKPRGSKPRPRRTEDDDFVAPDTFVSYETRRSSPR